MIVHVHVHIQFNSISTSKILKQTSPKYLLVQGGQTQFLHALLLIGCLRKPRWQQEHC